MCILYSHSTLQSHFITNYMANKGEMIIRISAILLLLLFRVGAQDGSASPPPGYMYPDFSPSLAVIVVVLISALFFMGFFSIYIRHCSDTSSVSTTVRNIGASIRGRTAARGLDKTILETFPTFGYSEVKDKKIGKGALECAVCLNEFEEEDTLRLIPKCDHVFHPECIDAWLESHVTCPVCRANLTEPVEIVQNLEPNDQPGEVSIRIAEDQTEDVTTTEPPQNRPMFPRSHTTGHLQVRSGENVDRFTLRLPEDFRKQVMTRALERTSSCVVVLPRESSSRRGFRTAFGRSFKRVDPIAKSDRWVFSMRRSFFSRGPSINSPKGEIGESSTSVRGTMKLPSFKCLEPKGDETCLMSGESSRPPV